MKEENNCDQDSIHNHKKLVNHLDHQSRSMRMGPNLIHLNHVRAVLNLLIMDFCQQTLKETTGKIGDPLNGCHSL